MKKIWIAASLALFGASFMYIPFSVGPYFIYINSFWLSSTPFARIAQVVVLISILGFLRDFSKHPGHVSSRLVKRTVIVLAFVIGLYLPWDGLVYQMNLTVKIVLTVLGILLWLVALALLFADEESTKSTSITPAPTEPTSFAPAPTALPVPATPATSVKVGTGICSECGTKNPPSGNYCKRCGKQL